MGRFCERIYLRDSYIAVESSYALERQDLRVWHQTTGLFGSTYHTLEHVSSQGSPGGRHASPSRRSANAPPYPALSGWWRLRRPSASHLRRSEP